MLSVYFAQDVIFIYMELIKNVNVSFSFCFIFIYSLSCFEKKNSSMHDTLIICLTDTSS